jgi:hypothetical protein
VGFQNILGYLQRHSHAELHPVGPTQRDAERGERVRGLEARYAHGYRPHAAPHGSPAGLSLIFI